MPAASARWSKARHSVANNSARRRFFTRSGNGSDGARAKSLPLLGRAVEVIE